LEAAYAAIEGPVGFLIVAQATSKQPERYAT
jgi:hypothetical protein